jgi:hypothetical protein
MATPEEIERLRRQGHSLARIKKAQTLLDAVKAGDLSLDDAQAILRGETMQFPVFDPSDPALQHLPRVKVPKAATVDEAITIFEQAFEELTDE